MERILKKLISLLIVIFVFISSSVVCFGMQIDINSKETDKEYKNRDFVFKGAEDIIFTFNDELFFNGENKSASTEQKNLNNYIVMGICAILIIYWVILLLVFEKEELCDFTYENIDDINTLKKYNPMIAGCLADNRQALPRDVIAIVLNLIQKDYIKMEMIPNLKNGKENYIYMISENKAKKDGLDKSELYVLNWIFGFYEEEKVDLIKKLKELSKRKDFLKHLNKLDDIAQEELHKIGANVPKVPSKLRVFNIILAFITIIISAVHIMNNGINIQIYETTIWLFYLIVACILLVVPVFALTIHLILFMIVLLKKLIKSTADRHSGKRIVKMSALILIFMFILIAIIYVIVPDKYICLDIFMIGMSILIVKTDNLMTKHNKEVLNDYYALNEIKYRIKEYSLIKDEQINYIKLWDEYLIYAVAFGIPIPIVNKLKGRYKEDEDISYLARCESLYYICKAYLEVMWDMKFKKGTNLLNLDGLFGIEKYDKENDYHRF